MTNRTSAAISVVVIALVVAIAVTLQAKWDDIKHLEVDYSGRTMTATRLEGNPSTVVHWMVYEDDGKPMCGGFEWFNDWVDDRRERKIRVDYELDTSVLGTDHWTRQMFTPADYCTATVWSTAFDGAETTITHIIRKAVLR